MMRFVEEIDYYKLYCNIEDPGFLTTLDLEKSELIAFYLMMAPVVANRECFIPRLNIENLVHSENTPYQALRTLHALREKRVIFYELTETESHAEQHFDTATLIDHAYQKAMQDDESEAEVVEPASVYQEIQREKTYERYAVLNLEYPVLYYCFQEETAFRENWDVDTDLQLMYTAIRGDCLAKALTDGGFPIILEFLQYVQSLFNVPITRHTEKEQ